MLFSITVIVVNHKGGNIGAAILGDAATFNVAHREGAHPVGLDGAAALVQINEVLAVQSFDDFVLLGTKEGDQVGFSEHLFHG